MTQYYFQNFQPTPMVRSLAMRSLLAASLTATFIPGANAALTGISSVGGTGGSERCLTGSACSGGAYNGEISIVHALELDLGMSITRVDDSLDTIWQTTAANGGQVFARARYASDTNKLGYDSGSGYQFLVNSVGNNKVLVSDPSLFSGAHASNFVDADPISWTGIPVAQGNPFAFILNDTSTGAKWTSNNSGAGVGSAGYANSGIPHPDQMVTFKVLDPNSQYHYLIAWEDRPYAGSDKDFNDFVAEIRFVTPVPVPGAAWLFGSAMFAGLAVKRRSASQRV